LLALPELHAIQWVPGAGHEEVKQWIPLIRHIQDNGKGVQVLCQPEEVEFLMTQIRHEGLCLNTHCETEREAIALVDLVYRLSKR
jgi:hypothetical protein